MRPSSRRFASTRPGRGQRPARLFSLLNALASLVLAAALLYTHFTTEGVPTGLLRLLLGLPLACSLFFALFFRVLARDAAARLSLPFGSGPDRLLILLAFFCGGPALLVEHLPLFALWLANTICYVGLRVYARLSMR